MSRQIATLKRYPPPCDGTGGGALGWLSLDEVARMDPPRRGTLVSRDQGACPPSQMRGHCKKAAVCKA